MNALEELKRNILLECEEDHMGLWSVIRDAEELLPKRDEATLRQQVIEVLHQMLSACEIKAGFPANGREGFRAVRLSPEKIVERIERDWPPDRRPTIGEGLWFTKVNRSK
jgi:hypothetical protein